MLMTHGGEDVCTSRVCDVYAFQFLLLNNVNCYF